MFPAEAEPILKIGVETLPRSASVRFRSADVAPESPTTTAVPAANGSSSTIPPSIAPLAGTLILLAESFTVPDAETGTEIVAIPFALAVIEPVSDSRRPET